MVESLEVNHSSIVCSKTYQTLGRGVIFFIDKVREEVDTFCLNVEVKRLKRVREAYFFGAFECVLSLQESYLDFVEGDNLAPQIRLKISTSSQNQKGSKYAYTVVEEFPSKVSLGNFEVLSYAF